MNVELTINDCGKLVLKVYTNSPHMGPFTFYPPNINVTMRCYDCHDYWYDEHRKAGHFYCDHTKKTIKNINKIPKWCPKYKHLLKSFDLR